MGNARVGGDARRHRFKGRHDRELMTALGPVRLERSDACCAGCHQPGFPADRLVGFMDELPRRALAMAVCAGIHDPFRKAESLLRELAGWSVDADTLRWRCHEQARVTAEGRAERGGLPEAFTEAGGDPELHMDAGKVLVTDRMWHDIKVAVAVAEVLALMRGRGRSSNG